MGAKNGEQLQLLLEVVELSELADVILRSDEPLHQY